MFKVFELFLVFGGLLAFGFYELWSLRRYKARERAEAERKAREQTAGSG